MQAALKIINKLVGTIRMNNSCYSAMCLYVYVCPGVAYVQTCVRSYGKSPGKGAVRHGNGGNFW